MPAHSPHSPAPGLRRDKPNKTTPQLYWDQVRVSVRTYVRVRTYVNQFGRLRTPARPMPVRYDPWGTLTVGGTTALWKTMWMMRTRLLNIGTRHLEEGLQFVVPI